MTAHSHAAGLDLHEDKRIKQPVRAAATSNVSLSAPGSTIDGVTLVSGDRVLLTAQTAAAENGIRVWSGAASTLQRASDAASATDFVYGFKVYVREGSANAASYWTFTQSAAVTVDTTSLTFTKDGGSVGGGEVTGTDFKPSGLTGATSASRYVGATVSGAPASGTFAVGDYVVDQSGFMWICTSAGSPGTWTLSGFHNPMTTTGDLIVGGSSGTPTRLAASSITGQVLTSNGAGVAPTYQTPTGGGGGTGGTGGSIVPIQTQTPSGTGTVTFNVPTGFKNIFLTVSARGDTAATTATLRLQFNGDTGNNYFDQIFQASGASSSGADGNATGDAHIAIGPISAATAPANAASGYIIRVNDHAGTAFHKSATAFGMDRYGTASGNLENRLSGGLWASTAAITLVTLLLSAGNYASGSTVTLWGEADTAPVLLTSNSNLLAEAIVTSSQVSIDTGTLAQGYRDLRIIIDARSDAAVTNAHVRLTANGDAGSNYSSEIWQFSTSSNQLAESIAAANAICGEVPGASSVTGDAGVTSLVIPNYSSSSFNKSFASTGSWRLTTGSANIRFASVAGVWTSTAAITSLNFTLSSGNFAAGSVIRVYGEPAAAAGSSFGTGTRVRISANQSITSATATTINWDTEDNDADNQHYTSTANLTGTVAKTSSSVTLTGTSTAFTTELSVGQVISVPGTTTEKRVVIAIASNTSLTVNSAFANTASGQTASRVNSAIVFRQPGFFTNEIGIYSAALSTGAVTLALYLNSLTTATSGTAIAEVDPTAINASAGYDLVCTRQFQQWDFVEVVWTQNSGGAVNVLADERTHWAVNARPAVIVAVPYVNIQDQQASGTSESATSGSFQTRTLNAVASDSSGLVSLSSNQFTLPPGTYRYASSSPACQVGKHQARLQNITDSTTVLLGTSEYSEAATNVAQTRSIISGRFSITATKSFSVQHRVQTTNGSFGFGIAGSFGTEVYTIVEIWKEG